MSKENQTELDRRKDEEEPFVHISEPVDRVMSSLAREQAERIRAGKANTEVTE
jgi:hypothetical protein